MINKDDLTPEEIAALNDRNENFHGKHANLAKVKQYQTLSADVRLLLEKLGPDARARTEFPPDHSRQNTKVYMDICFVSSFDKECSDLLCKIIQESDRMNISALGEEKGIRFSFSVDKVWGD